ncbi:MAG: NYN domain-containing protein [Planctomycetota bacterium]|nr:NYN domain-containing protein [Planctomycetota bacterium]
MILIDGYNLLWAVNQTSDTTGSPDDVELCRILGRYLKQIGQSGEIIFDGIGPPDKTGFDNITNLEVFFSGRNSDADTVIEDKIKADTAPKSLLVVSSDRRLRDAAHSRKAESVKSQVFWNDVQKELSKKEKLDEPTQKQQWLTESETEQWLKLFGIEQ